MRGGLPPGERSEAPYRGTPQSEDATNPALDEGGDHRPLRDLPGRGHVLLPEALQSLRTGPVIYWDASALLSVLIKDQFTQQARKWAACSFDQVISVNSTSIPLHVFG